VWVSFKVKSTRYQTRRHFLLKSRRHRAHGPTGRAARRWSNLQTMEARQVDDLPANSGWQFEPKWDGFRCLAVRHQGGADLIGRSGKHLTRYFPDIARDVVKVEGTDFVLDGELAIPTNGSLSFDRLQLRLHPSEKRVEKLAHETPAIYIVFDLLAVEGSLITQEPLAQRRSKLESLFPRLAKHVPTLRLSPYTRDPNQARKWLSRAGHGALDGVVAKEIAAPYQEGKRAMLKVKCLRSADCVVGGFRYLTGVRSLGSLLLGLYNEEGLLDHVGFTSGFSEKDRKSVLAKIEPLRGGRGFTGSAPGGPSRWATERSTQWEPLRPKLVVEVQYDHITADRFRHGTRFLRWRPDKRPHDCTTAQLIAEARPSRLLRQIMKP
jgi:ATP-dependent DNA ligase